MKTPKCKHNVTLDSECADCIEIKTDNSQVLINQDKLIEKLQLKLDEQIALLDQTPNQSLNKLKADAVKSFAVALAYHEDFIHLRDCIEEFQKEYASKLKGES